MFNVPAETKRRIYDLASKVFDPTRGTGDHDMSAYIEFTKLRKSILAVTPSFVCEFEIIKLLGTRMKGMTVMYTPRTFIDFDFEPATIEDRDSKSNELKKFFDDAIEVEPKITLEGLRYSIDLLLPCNSREDLEFGLEALYCIAAVNDGKHKSTWFPGPAN